MQKQKNNAVQIIALLSALFLLASGSVIFFGIHYIQKMLLRANEATAVDIALLVEHNFEISDAEVAYMKSLSFNEMEADPINARLMNIGNGVMLNADITNVYLVAPLAENECRVCETAAEAELLDVDIGTELDGLWLLNGLIGDDGNFVAAQREDICRYTVLTEDQKNGFANKISFGEYSSDVWGTFITGYAPVYTTEGSFVGLIGIDMAPDKFQSYAQKMVFYLLLSFGIVTLLQVGLFVVFYKKYTKAREHALYQDFYARMSHDLRTPMNGILGMAALSHSETDIAVLHHDFEMVEESGRYMLELINDTLDIQKIDAGKLALNPQIFHCRERYERVLEMVRVLAEQKDICLTSTMDGTDMDSYVYLDETRAKQIFMNLLSNAIKFTPQGGHIAVSMACTGCEGQMAHIVFRVKDDGIGMSEAFIARSLFKPFAQEYSSSTTQFAGTGLGLSITKRLVELMGGTIEAQSAPGRGTTFTVRMDVRHATDAEIAAARAAETAELTPGRISLAGRHILLCEDHPLNAEIARRLLENRGCIVTTAENGQAGLTAFSASDPGFFDAVLMDIRMPVLDGLQAARAIRALPRSDAKTVPILAMTANAYAEDIRNSMAVGMNAHLSKPIAPQILYDTLEECIVTAK